SFEVRLPLEVIAEAPLREAADSPALATPKMTSAQTGTLASEEASGLSLLLVEDDPIVAEVIAGLLRGQGHAVVHAGHGLAALAESSMTRFDAALLDLDLPGLDGLSLARQLRAQGFSQ